jgi:hypothetical protein
MPVQSLVAPEGLSNTALVDAIATVGTLEVDIPDLLSVMITILDILIAVCSTEVVDELDELDLDELEVMELDIVELGEDVDVADEVKEVAIPLVAPRDTEATKSQLLATNN